MALHAGHELFCHPHHHPPSLISTFSILDLRFPQSLLSTLVSLSYHCLMPLSPIEKNQTINHNPRLQGHLGALPHHGPLVYSSGERGSNPKEHKPESLCLSVSERDGRRKELWLLPENKRGDGRRRQGRTEAPEKSEEGDKREPSGVVHFIRGFQGERMREKEERERSQAPFLPLSVSSCLPLSSWRN